MAVFSSYSFLKAISHNYLLDEIHIKTPFPSMRIVEFDLVEKLYKEKIQPLLSIMHAEGETMHACMWK